MRADMLRVERTNSAFGRYNQLRLPMSPRSIVLDTGALLPGERNDPTFSGCDQKSLDKGALIVAATGCIVEAWRGGSRQAGLSRVFNTINEFMSIDYSAAKRIGELLAASQTAEVFDASVVDAAIAYSPCLIITSDQVDIRRLLTAPTNGDVIVYPI
jgi:hypothetical protein